MFLTSNFVSKTWFSFRVKYILKLIKMILKKLFLFFILLLSLSYPTNALLVDLNQCPVYVKEGFDSDWLKEKPDEREWLVIPPTNFKDRKIEIKSLPLKKNYQRKFLSLAKEKVQIY